jgi:hypothetical protein
MTGHVQYFKNDTFVVSAFQSTIQYTALIQVFGDQSARMFSWVSGVVIIILIIALGERVGLSKQARSILLALLVTSTVFLDLMGDGKVDLISSAPALAAIYWMAVEDHNDKFNKSRFILIGFLSGLAMIARPNNVLLMGVFIGLYYCQKTLFKNGYKFLYYKQFIDSIFWIGIGAIGLGIYHLLANWIILGDPLDFLSTASNINPSQWMVTVDPNQIIIIRLLYPIAATFLNTPQSLGNITPLFLAFLPAILIRDIRKRTIITEELKYLLAICIVTLLLWICLFFTVLEIRYVLFIWAILFMPLAEIIAVALDNRDDMFKNLSGGLIIIFLIFNIWRTIYISLDTYSPIDVQGNPQCNTSRFCEYLKPINKIASQGDRVLTLSAFRYYLRTDLFTCSTGHGEYQRLQTAYTKGSLVFGRKCIVRIQIYRLRKRLLPVICS